MTSFMQPLVDLATSPRRAEDCGETLARIGYADTKGRGLCQRTD